jgi:hypothetical protein
MFPRRIRIGESEEKAVMRKARILRNVAFGLFVLSAVSAIEVRLLAANHERLTLFWGNWNSQYECDYSISTWNQTWSASGTCDFTNEADPLGLGNEFCSGAFDACATDCESRKFQDFLVSEHCPVFDEFDPACYWDCWLGWAGENSCSDVSETQAMWADCTCAYLNWCE